MFHYWKFLSFSRTHLKHFLHVATSFSVLIHICQDGLALSHILDKYCCEEKHRWSRGIIHGYCAICQKVYTFSNTPAKKKKKTKSRLILKSCFNSKWFLNEIQLYLPILWVKDNPPTWENRTFPLLKHLKDQNMTIFVQNISSYVHSVWLMWFYHVSSRITPQAWCRSVWWMIAKLNFQLI